MNGANFKTGRWGLWEVALITFLALAFRLLHVEELRHTDSYFHMMAAASWLKDGTLSLGGEVPYDRVHLFTYLVAAFQSLFGGTTFVAGLPAILAGAAWVTALFLWVRSVAGRTAAWVAGLLFCFDVGSLALAHMVRFYTLHGLTFFLGAIGLYYLVTARPSLGKAVIIGLAVIAAFSLAYHLQYTTVIGVIALAVWLVIELSPRIWRYLRENRSIGMVLAVAFVVAGAGAAWLFVQSGLAAQFWGSFRGVPGWAEHRQDRFWYYISGLLERTYPLLWMLFPFAVIIAVARYGRPAIFSIVLFAVPVILHSLAAFKSTRFLSYAMPFYFAIGGFAVAAVMPKLEAIAKQAVLNVSGIGLPHRAVSFATWSLLALVFVAFLVTSRPNWWDAAAFIAHNERPFGERWSRWDEAAKRLEPLIDSVDVVVISSGAVSYYYMKHVHVLVHTGASADQEFVSAGRQLGVPIISLPQSLETLVRCHNSGLVAISEDRWGTWRFNDAMIEALQANAQPLALPEEWRIRAYTWSHEEDVGQMVDCPVLEAHRAPRL